MRIPSCIVIALLALGACKKDADKQPAAAAPAADSGTAPHWAELLLGKVGGKRLGQGSGSYADCLKEMEQKLPPELGVVLPDYYDVPDAICRMRQALTEDNPEICRKANTSTLRKGCETAYAIYRQKPDDCPLSYLGRHGRDAACVALALRNPVLCLGARYEDQEVACRAILQGDIDDCRSLRYSKRPRCEAQVRRWKPLLKGVKVQDDFPRGYKPSLELTLTSRTGGNPLPVAKLSLDCAAAGAVAPDRGDSEHVVICEQYGHRYRYGRASRQAYRVKLDFSFRPPSKQGEVIRFGPDARLALRITRGGTYESTGQGEVKVTTFERKRGGRVAGSFKVTVTGSSIRRGVMAEAEELIAEGTFDTFVRDLVDPAKLRRGSRYRYGLGSRYGSRGVLGSLGSKGSGGSGASGLLGQLRSLRRRGSAPAERPRRFAALLTAATLTRVNVGQRSGLQLSAIVRNSLWERLGLQEGDVLFKVGRVTLQRRADVSRIRGELRSANRLSINLRRGKRNRTLSLARPALQALRQEFTL